MPKFFFACTTQLKEWLVALFSSLGDPRWVGEGWQIKRDYLEDSLVTDVEFSHEELGVQLRCNDLVDFDQNLYMKKLTLTNLADQERKVRLFLAHDFRRSGMQKILEYFKKYRVFLPYDMDFWLIPDLKMYSVNKDIVSNRVGAPTDNNLPNYLEKNYEKKK